MSEFQQYRRSQIAELRPYVEGETLSGRVSISTADRDAGSPKAGDMIARNPANHDDQWLIAAKYFADNFEPIAAQDATTPVVASLRYRELSQKLVAILKENWEDPISPVFVIDLEKALAAVLGQGETTARVTDEAVRKATAAYLTAKLECKDALPPSGIHVGSHNAQCMRAALQSVWPASGERDAVDAARLDWLEDSEINEVVYAYDEDEEEFLWKVWNIHGPVNDREWEEIGRGKTVREAIDAAIAAGNTCAT